MEPWRAPVRAALWSVAVQGRERRGDQGQHPGGQVQVRVALQGGQHGGHQAAHVDLQEGTLVSWFRLRVVTSKLGSPKTRAKPGSA